MEKKLKRVIVTRPEQQALEWIRRIEQAGLQASYIPALSIVPLSEAQHQQAIKNAILKLDENNWLIFISQNAVKYAFDWIDDFWPQFPLGPKCLPIGAKTRDALDARLAAFAETSATDSIGMRLMNSEELLEAECLQNIAGEKITIFRGLGGRTLLHEVLSERGADVSHCELYQRQLPEEGAAAIAEQGINVEEDLLTIFSGESLSNFHQLLLSVDVTNWQSLKIIVPSHRVKEQAQALGYNNITVATNAGEDAMWQALQEAIKQSEI